MDEARYVVFAAEARAQLQQIALIHERIDHRERESGVAGLESLAYQLHNNEGPAGIGQCVAGTWR